MKIAVLSDIHGNVPALEAVLEDIHAWGPDRVIVNGDVVNRGPYSRQVLELLRESTLGCELLSGNHETFTLYAAEHPPEAGDPGFELRRFAHWTAEQLGPAILEELRRWPDHLDIADLEGGASVHVTHGSRRGNRDGISASTPDEELPHKLGEPRELFIASHTHKSMLRRFNGTLVVNTGSVGQPLDGDPRAAYGRFMFRGGQWQAELRRVEYDKPRAERDFIQSGFIEGGGPLAGLIAREHRECRMHVGPFMRRYHDAIKSGEISVAQAIAAHLAQL